MKEQLCVKEGAGNVGRGIVGVKFCTTLGIYLQGLMIGRLESWCERP